MDAQTKADWQDFKEANQQTPMKTTDNMSKKAKVKQSQDPQWSRWMVIYPNRDSEWLGTEAQARQAAEDYNKAQENKDTIEIQGCKEDGDTLPDGRKPVSREDINPQFYSVYLRHYKGEAEWLSDCPTLDDAIGEARLFGLPVVILGATNQ